MGILKLSRDSRISQTSGNIKLFLRLKTRGTLGTAGTSNQRYDEGAFPSMQSYFKQGLDSRCSVLRLQRQLLMLP